MLSAAMIPLFPVLCIAGIVLVIVAAMLFPVKTRQRDRRAHAPPIREAGADVQQDAGEQALREECYRMYCQLQKADAEKKRLTGCFNDPMGLIGSAQGLLGFVCYDLDRCGEEELYLALRNYLGNGIRYHLRALGAEPHPPLMDAGQYQKNLTGNTAAQLRKLLERRDREIRGIVEERGYRRMRAICDEWERLDTAAVEKSSNRQEIAAYARQMQALLERHGYRFLYREQAGEQERHHCFRVAECSNLPAVLLDDALVFAGEYSG